MEDYQIIFMRIREFIRKNSKTNYGKNQIIILLDEMENTIKKEKQIENINTKKIEL